MTRKTSLYIIIAVLLIIMFGMIGFKVFYLGYRFSHIVPRTSYSVDITMNFAGFGDEIIVQTFLPKKEKTQMIQEELNTSPGLDFSHQYNQHNIKGEWTKSNAKGPFFINYSFSAQIQPVKYVIDPQLRIPDVYPKGLKEYLNGTEAIQTDDPFILSLSKMVNGKEGHIETTLRKIYDHVSELETRPFKGLTDAVTTAKLGAASCNGKSRLFVAMARNAGIPARLVGGLILDTGIKKTSHQWVEAYVSGHWIPFDTVNHHFASLPENYLVLYRGDKVLFKHSTNIGFDYRFRINKRIIPNYQLAEFLGGHSLNLYNFLNSFKRSSISLNLLKIILMLPLGVLVVVISRNIIGMDTFGTFLPALMAIAVRETRLIPGIFAFIFVLAVTIIVRYPLDRFGILHTPKLAIMMVTVILSLLSLTIISDQFLTNGFSSIGSATLFPIAILTITSERFAIGVEEQGFYKTLLILFQTLIVMSLCYLVMNSLGLQTLILAFPELLIGTIALNLWLGSWIGLRVSELFRFRSLIMNQEQSLEA